MSRMQREGVTADVRLQRSTAPCPDGRLRRYGHESMTAADVEITLDVVERPAVVTAR